MATCNFCNLRAIKNRAKKTGMKVTVIYSTRMGHLGGKEIYVHPKNMKLGLNVSEDNHKKYWVSWMMEIPESCTCD
jgi:hypothetical protein